ncbi:MAG TPA: hypothetical protein VMH77_09625 [Steroidobacteraceae bacterium]|nr:hypothetical protein [Steroidobacteraceae bacterium]
MEIQAGGGLLRSMFGPSKAQVWQQLSQQVHGQYLDGGWMAKDKVVARSGPWTITLDTYTVSTGKSSITYTRLRAPYVNPDNFRFLICRSSIFTPLAEMLGITDVAIGDPVFDKDFVTKSADPAKLKSLLADAELRGLLMQQPKIRLEVRDSEGWFGASFPPDVDELCFTAIGVIKDLQLLKGLYDLFGRTLHLLCQLGSAYERDPDVTLK